MQGGSFPYSVSEKPQGKYEFFLKLIQLNVSQNIKGKRFILLEYWLL